MSPGLCISILDMPLLIDSCFFRLQVCLNLFFLSWYSCLSSEFLMLWEIFSPRDCKFSLSVLHSWSNHFICDLHLILLPLTFYPASLHASIKVSLSNSDKVSMLSCLTAATNLDWTVYINSDMSSPTGPAGKHMPATFCYSPATENLFDNPVIIILIWQLGACRPYVHSFKILSTFDWLKSHS